MPSAQSNLHPYLQHEGPIPFAHRGGASAAPENTLTAFQDAVSLGYRYLETDVHATRDGVLVAFHDNDLSRTCGINGRIDEMTWNEVASARVHGSEPIPLLEDILGSFPSVNVNIDCKADTAVDPLIAAIRRTDSLARVCLGSFSDSRLGKIREALGEGACMSAGPLSVARLVLAARTHRIVAGARHIQAAQVPVSQGPLTVVNERFISLCHDLGLHVHVWTIDDPAEMNRLLDLGVDGVMTDDTRALKDVLTTRGVWNQ